MPKDDSHSLPHNTGSPRRPSISTTSHQRERGPRRSLNFSRLPDVARYRVHIGLSSQRQQGVTSSNIFECNSASSIVDSAKGSPQPHPQVVSGPQDVLDARFGPLVIDDFDFKMDPNADAKNLSTPSSNWWKSQFTGLSSFTVNEDTTSPSEVTFGVLHLFKEDDQRSKSGETPVLEDDSGTILAVLGLPSQITASDFLTWVEPAKDSLEKLRMVREINLARCTVLMKFRDAINAEEFYKQFSQQSIPYLSSGRGGSSQEATSSATTTAAAPLAHIVYVTQVTVSSSSRLPYAYPQLANSDPWPLAPIGNDNSTSEADPADGSVSTTSTDPATRLALSLAQELPTCPVCLERMDSTVTGLMTVSCQHTFHCDCLSRWGDARCPVCRYSQNKNNSGGPVAAALLRARRGLGHEDEEADQRQVASGSGSTINDNDAPPTTEEEASRCMLCSTTDDLWVCLICATVGCGRYKRGCAKQHFVESGHIYSLELETSRVWDYIHDGYIHRLIQNRADGKLVELPSSSQTTPSRRRRGARRAQEGAAGGSNQKMSDTGSGRRRVRRRRRRRIRVDDGGQGSSSRGDEEYEYEYVQDDGGGEDGDYEYYTSDEYSDEEEEGDYDKHDAEKSDGKLGTAQDKLEAISLEYQYLLLSQLESQRAYYEEQVRHLQSESSQKQKDDMDSELCVMKSREEAHLQKIDALESQLQDSSHQHEKESNKYTKLCKISENLSKDLQSERLVTSNLMNKIEVLNGKNDLHQKEISSLKNELGDVRDQLKDVMFALSVREQIDGGNSKVGEEIQGGDVILPPSQTTSSSGGSSKKKKKKKQPLLPPPGLAQRQSQMAAGGQGGSGQQDQGNDKDKGGDESGQTANGDQSDNGRPE
ncbi:unnamed protein product [Sympodiomycopsis kandeliae]